MNIEQTKRRILVMQKHGEPGWRTECWYSIRWSIITDPNWDCGSLYRAVRVETTAGRRVPLPWSRLKVGALVRVADAPDVEALVVAKDRVSFRTGRGSIMYSPAAFTTLEYFDGLECQWLPLWTEKPGGERIVEVISEDVV